MLNAVFRKSIGDLRKRKSRTFFTILTIVLGVSALGMFAVVPLMDANMFHQLDRCNMHDALYEVNDLDLTDQNFNDLSSLPNVNAVEGKYIFFTRMYIGDRRADALIVGVEDFDDQQVDRVLKTSGEYPGNHETLTDDSNARVKLYTGGAGDTIRLFDSNGDVREINVTGGAYNNDYSQYPAWGTALLYMDIDTVRELANGTGYIILSFDMEKAGKADLEDATASIEGYLKEHTNFTAFQSLPSYNVEGDYPGKSNFSDMGQFFYVLTFMTMGCSLFLIMNTMHTMITEQKKEICQMKAIGATRIQIVRTYITTAAILGIIGSIFGTILGIFIAYGMLYFLSTSFYGVVPSFAIHVPTVIMTLVAGIVATVLASIPALYQGIKVPVREGMESTGISANFGSSLIDRILLRNRAIPRTMQMGFRNVSRKKGRSLSTVIQIMLAVGMFLGVATIGYSLTETVRTEFDYFTYDIQAMGAGEGAKAISIDMLGDIGSIDGVALAEPVIWKSCQIGSDQVLMMGYDQATKAFAIDRIMIDGRWFTPQEEAGSAKVIVLSKIMASVHGKTVGDSIGLVTPLGKFDFEIVGVQKSQMMNGLNLFMPISTIQNVTGDGSISGFAVITTSKDHKLIDRVATEIEDRMLAKGYVVTSGIFYVIEEQNIRANADITNLMLAVGTLIVLITSIGLMSTLTMNVIERTREIGMLRCIGSRSWDIRKVFGSEGLTLAVIGATFGIPVGWGVGLFIAWMIKRLLHFQLYYEFPAFYMAFAFVITVVLTLLVIQLPLRRAVRLKPGDAIRYA
jgi:putative ABC transport system permease protein